MANSRCPGVLHDEHFRVSTAVMLRRLEHNKRKDTNEIMSPQPEAYWPGIAKIASEGKDDLSTEKVIALSKEIQEFHGKNSCECFGKALCHDITDCGAPQIPEVGQMVKWYGGNSCVTGIHSPKKWQSFSNASSSQTLEMPNHQESLNCEVPPPFMTMHADSMKLADIISRHNICGKLKIDLLLAIGSSPLIGQSVLASNEEELHYLLRGVSPTAYMQWLQRMKP